MSRPPLRRQLEEVRAAAAASQLECEDLTSQEATEGELQGAGELPARNEAAAGAADEEMGPTEQLEDVNSVPPPELLELSQSPGWSVDRPGRPVLVRHAAWAFVTPEPRHSAEHFPRRST